MSGNWGKPEGGATHQRWSAHPVHSFSTFGGFREDSLNRGTPRDDLPLPLRSPMTLRLAGPAPQRVVSGCGVCRRASSRCRVRSSAEGPGAFGPAPGFGTFQPRKARVTCRCQKSEYVVASSARVSKEVIRSTGTGKLNVVDVRLDS